ncbi:MAG: AzlD domain-containing protein [Lachnospiraceae bacterium]|nr:AzlD domain-containing protein [Lachnospiraceae bacterium]
MVDSQVILTIVVAALATMFTRFLPFLIFNGKKKIPDYVMYLGDRLPYAIIAMLIIYCLKDVSFNETANYLPNFIAIGVVAILHFWRKNTLLSIIGGTAVYMILVQVVFV